MMGKGLLRLRRAFRAGAKKEPTLIHARKAKGTKGIKLN